MVRPGNSGLEEVSRDGPVRLDWPGVVVIGGGMVSFWGVPIGVVGRLGGRGGPIAGGAGR